MFCEALESPYSLFGATREIPCRYPPAVAPRLAAGSGSYAQLAVAVLTGSTDVARDTASSISRPMRAAAFPGSPRESGTDSGRSPVIFEMIVPEGERPWRVTPSN